MGMYVGMYGRTKRPELPAAGWPRQSLEVLFPKFCAAMQHLYSKVLVFPMPKTLISIQCAKAMDWLITKTTKLVSGHESMTPLTRLQIC